MPRISTAAALRSIACIGLLLAVAVSIEPSAAQDTVDGAIWSFTLQNVEDPGKRLAGRFRISNGEMFQKAGKDSETYAKRVGTARINGKRNAFDVNELRAFTGPNRRDVYVTGKGLIKVIEFGHWDGRFTDAKGRNWKMNAKRIIE